MMPAVSDSVPFIHLAILQHTDLLPHYFQPLLTVSHVYDEVVTQGSGRPGAHELATACERGVVRVEVPPSHRLSLAHQGVAHDHAKDSCLSVWTHRGLSWALLISPQEWGTAPMQKSDIYGGQDPREMPA